MVADMVAFVASQFTTSTWDVGAQELCSVVLIFTFGTGGRFHLHAFFARRQTITRAHLLHPSPHRRTVSWCGRPPTLIPSTTQLHQPIPYYHERLFKQLQAFYIGRMEKSAGHSRPCPHGGRRPRRWPASRAAELRFPPPLVRWPKHWEFDKSRPWVETGKILVKFT